MRASYVAAHLLRQGRCRNAIVSGKVRYASCFKPAERAVCVRRERICGVRKRNIGYGFDPEGLSLRRHPAHRRFITYIFGITPK
jgi:hypothetical protein